MKPLSMRDTMVVQSTRRVEYCIAGMGDLPEFHVHFVFAGYVDEAKDFPAEIGFGADAWAVYKGWVSKRWDGRAKRRDLGLLELRVRLS